MGASIRRRALRLRRCKHCKELYRRDARNGWHQEYCSKPGCRQASKKASQRRWLNSPKGRGYFRGPENVERVRQWRAAHPGYGKRGASGCALQDILPAQVVDKQRDACAAADIQALLAQPLQDIYPVQSALLIGMVATLSGSTLQDDIAETTRRFIVYGRDILRGRL